LGDWAYRKLLLFQRLLAYTRMHQQQQQQQQWQSNNSKHK